jgi:membrane protease YdiL (CAAX protease family)
MTEAHPESGVKFGPWQGLWLLLGYLAAQTLGYLLVTAPWGAWPALLAKLHHRAPPVGIEPSPVVLAWATLAGFLLSSVWAVWYVRRRAKPLLHRGEATGIAWRAPKLRAYGAAVAVAILAMLFGALMFQFFPPDPDKLTGPTSRLLEAPGLPRLTVMLLAVAGAPLMEEFMFRGALFAALARRLSTAWAGTLTTLVFVALHAADKLSWWPGFVAVGFLGALLLVLRLRYKSLWPGILAHCLYNSSFFLLS